MRDEIAGICQKVRTVRNGWCEASASEAADEILSLIREKVKGVENPWVRTLPPDGDIDPYGLKIQHNAFEQCRAAILKELGHGTNKR